MPKPDMDSSRYRDHEQSTGRALMETLIVVILIVGGLWLFGGC
jgi:heme/copper-type cytochrome/quinol oxidase subunit 4